MPTEIERLAIKVQELRTAWLKVTYDAYREAERVYRATQDAEKEQRRLQPGGTLA